MSIQAIGAKNAYVVVVGAFCVEQRRPTLTVNHMDKASAWIVADSLDEAAGIAMRIARAVYPEANEWKDHFFHIVPVAGIASISPFVIESVQPKPRPW